MPWWARAIAMSRDSPKSVFGWSSRIDLLHDGCVTA